MPVRGDSSLYDGVIEGALIRVGDLTGNCFPEKPRKNS
jgi:hypothetical protein